MICKNATSDKEYNVWIEVRKSFPKLDVYEVRTSWGPTGNPRSEGLKGTFYDQRSAERQLEKVVQSKLVKQYKPVTSAAHITAAGIVPIVSNTSPLPPIMISIPKQSKHLPQLLNPIDEARAQELLLDPDYWMQQKLDGDRQAIEVDASTVQGINRLGNYISLPSTLTAEIQQLGCDLLLDGERVGECFYAFDMLSYNNLSLANQPYYRRYDYLYKVLETFNFNYIKIVPTAKTVEEKNHMFINLSSLNVEGFVFKKKAAVYTAGRPNREGSQLKYKLWKTASVVVMALNDKNSFQMGAYKDGNIVNIGNCTGRNKYDLQVGDLVEVKYLYFQAALVQPECLRKRDDIKPEECTYDQLVSIGTRAAVNV